LTTDCNLTCQSELAIVHGPTLTGQLRKIASIQQPSALAVGIFFTARQLKKGWRG